MELAPSYAAALLVRGSQRRSICRFVDSSSNLFFIQSLPYPTFRERPNDYQLAFLTPGISPL